MNEGFKEQIYVIPAFFKPGRNLLVAALPNDRFQTPNYYVTRLLNLKREEDPIVHQKNLKVVQISRHYEKHKSVFKDWIEDTEETTDWIYTHDTRMWKAHKLIKDGEDLAQTLRVFKQYIP